MKDILMDIPAKHMSYFMEICRYKTLNKAARAVGKGGAFFRCALTSLERKLGCSLCTLDENGFTLTDEGKVFLEVCKEVLNFVEDEFIACHFTEHKNEKTSLTVAATLWDTEYLLPHVLKDFYALHPNVTVNVVSGLEHTRMDDIETDISIGLYLHKRQDLNQRLIRDFPVGMFATPAYLEQHGTPETLDDIKNHEFLVHQSFLPLPGKLYRNNNCLVTSNHHLLLLNIAMKNKGIIIFPNETLKYMPEYDKKLIRVLPDFESNHFSMFFLNRKQTQKDKLVESFYQLSLKHCYSFEV